MTVSVQRSPALVGRLRPPSDKSLTHRAFMLGAAAESPSFIQHPLLGEDCVSTLRFLESMGLRYDIRDGTVHLEPAAEWSNPDALLDCGNSGTTMRLLFLCGGPSPVLASRQHQSACMPLVIHILVPLTT